MSHFPEPFLDVDLRLLGLVSITIFSRSSLPMRSRIKSWRINYQAFQPFSLNVLKAFLQCKSFGSNDTLEFDTLMQEKSRSPHSPLALAAMLQREVALSLSLSLSLSSMV